MARAPMPAPQMIETPAMRRSALLAKMLEEQRQPTEIRGGYGELGARLLAQGITQWGANKADKTVRSEREGAMNAQRAALIAALGGGSPASAPAPGTAMADAIAPQPAAPPVTNTQIPQQAEIAPAASIQGAPLPPQGAMSPPAPTPAPQAPPQPAPASVAPANPLGPTPQEIALLQQAANSGDPGQLAWAQQTWAEIQMRMATPPEIDIQVGPDGTSYNSNDPAALNQRFRNVENVNGFLVDTNDPAAGGRYLPDLQQGEEPVYDQNGRIVGTRNLAGAIEALAGRERATADARNASEASYAGPIASATAQAQAPYQIETVQGPAGQPIAMSREALLSGGGMAGQTPADAIREQGLATREVERGGNRVQAEGRMRAAAMSAQNLASTVERARGQIGALSTGLVGAATGGLPGTPARDLRATIETIKANVGFDYLQQMRELSPTGGALGQVAVQEMQALQAVLGNLDPNQSPEQLDRNLEQIQRIVEQGLRNRQAVFEEQYGGATGGAQSGPARPRAINPQTDAVVEFDGQSWVPVR